MTQFGTTTGNRMRQGFRLCENVGIICCLCTACPTSTLQYDMRPQLSLWSRESCLLENSNNQYVSQCTCREFAGEIEVTALQQQTLFTFCSSQPPAHQASWSVPFSFLYQVAPRAVALNLYTLDRLWPTALDARRNVFRLLTNQVDIAPSSRYTTELQDVPARSLSIKVSARRPSE